MIGITHPFLICINKTAIQRKYHRFILRNLLLNIIKNIVEPIGLRFATAKNIVGVAFGSLFVEVFNKELKLFIESRLWLRMESDAVFDGLGFQMHGTKAGELFF